MPEPIGPRDPGGLEGDKIAILQRVRFFPGKTGRATRTYSDFFRLASSLEEFGWTYIQDVRQLLDDHQSAVGHGPLDPAEIGPRARCSREIFFSFRRPRRFIAKSWRSSMSEPNQTVVYSSGLFDGMLAQH